MQALYPILFPGKQSREKKANLRLQAKNKRTISFQLYNLPGRMVYYIYIYFSYLSWLGNNSINMF